MLDSAEHEILNVNKYKKYQEIKHFSGSDKPKILFFLLIKVEMPTTVRISIFMNRKKFMLSWVEHEKSFITLGAVYLLRTNKSCLKIILHPHTLIWTSVPKKIYHHSLMQNEKSQLEGKWIMPETRFTEFLSLSLDLRVVISQSASETNVYFSYLWHEKFVY